MPLRVTQAHPRSESAQSSASRHQLSVLNLNTSQTNLGQQSPQQQPSSSALNFVSQRHSTSHVSLREAGSFSNGFDDGTYLDPAFYPGDRSVDGDSQHRSQASLKQEPQRQSSSALNLVSPVRHSTSCLSLREAGSFANGFDDGTYLDPAFYPGEPVVENNFNRPVSRGSTSSSLSYV